MNIREQFRSALINTQATTINECLTGSPELLTGGEREGQDLIFEVASQGKCEAIEMVLQHPAYTRLDVPQKHEILRDALSGSLEYALKCYVVGTLNVSLQVLEKLLVWNQGIVEKNNDDYSLFHFTLYLLAAIHLTQKNFSKAMHALLEAISAGEKITSATDEDYYTLIYCYNALGKCYAVNKDFEKAKLCFTQARECFLTLHIEEPRRSILLFCLEDNLAILKGLSMEQKSSDKTTDLIVQHVAVKPESKAEPLVNTGLQAPSKDKEELEKKEVIKDKMPVNVYLRKKSMAYGKHDTLSKWKQKNKRDPLYKSPQLFTQSAVVSRDGSESVRSFRAVKRVVRSVR